MGLESLDLTRLQLFVEPENAASRALAERCGWVHEGTLRSHAEGDGRRHDSLVHGPLPGELRQGASTSGRRARRGPAAGLPGWHD
jgi:RimJ/RimL family protein N-acetyltransferase